MTNKIITAVFFLLSIVSRNVYSQPENLCQMWPAVWIAPTDGTWTDFSVSYFRRNFALDSIPKTLVVNTSGDARYKLYVNGQYVTRGPLTGDLRHWFYEITDIAPFLKVGENVIAVSVLNYGSHPPDARSTIQTAFILAAGDKKYRFLNSDEKWKATVDLAYAPSIVDKKQIMGYYGGGSREIVDANKLVWGWQKSNFDESAWENAVMVERAYAKEYIWASRWKLTPRTILHEQELTQRFDSVRIANGVNIPDGFPKQAKTVKISPNTKARIVLDQGVVTTAYPVFIFNKGKNAQVKITYSEAPYEGDPKNKNKGNRNEVEGKTFTGYSDFYTADGQPEREFTTFHWRTFRYLVLDIQTAEQELEINDMYSIYSAYPFETKAKISLMPNANTKIDSSTINKIIEIGDRTLRLCSHETFVDCPYYEESQFEGDARVEALISYYNYGDSALGKNAVEQFSWSINDEGFLSARYPTNSLYYIPNFSIYWIGMLHDYMMHFNDKEFIAQKLSIARFIMSYFEGLQRADGTIKKPAYHNFVDWTFKYGEPPFDSNNYSAVVDLHYLLALKWMIDLEKFHGNINRIATLQNQYVKLKKSILNTYWNSKTGLFSDIPKGDKYSQHSNCLAIITGVVEGNDAKAIMQKVLTDSTLTQASVYWSFYLFEAMKITGLGDGYVQQLEKWKLLIDAGLTTWPETGLISRSECHGWGASPNYHLYKIVAGVEPTSPGFNDIVINPSIGFIDSLDISMPVSGDLLKIKIVKLKDNKMNANIYIPVGKRGVFIKEQKKVVLKEGWNILK